jgi:hypothetical protein
MRSKTHGSRKAPEMLTVRPDVAWAMLGVSASTGWKLVRHREIGVVRYGPNLTLVPIASLQDFLERHAVAARAPVGDAQPLASAAVEEFVAP